MRKLLSITTLLLLYFFCGNEVNGTNIVLQWNQATLNAVKATSSPPTIAARALAIAHTAMYDAWASYDDKAIGTMFEALLRRPSDEHTLVNKEEAISFAAFRALVDLFPSQTASFTNLMISLGFNPSDASTDITTPVGIGNTVAEALLHFRHGDGANQLADQPNTIGGPYSDYTGYAPVNSSSSLNDPSRWQPPTPTASFLTPHWGLVIPFSLNSGNQFLPERGPASYPGKRYNRQAKELLSISAKLNDKSKSIAVYWADGPGTETPPGHWNLIGQFVSNRDNHTLDEDVKMFFALTNALFDASIACWNCKRTFDYVRPISAIRFLYNDIAIKAWGGPCQGTQEIFGQNWQPYISTPSFPEFVSGHSTFSAAAAEVLKLFTGSDKYKNSVTLQAGSSPIEPGCVPSSDVTLYWKTFSEAADEAGMSRRYGGIHFKDGDMEARKLGRQVGITAFKLANYYIRGG